MLKVQQFSLHAFLPGGRNNSLVAMGIAVFVLAETRKMPLKLKACSFLFYTFFPANILKVLMVTNKGRKNDT